MLSPLEVPDVFAGAECAAIVALAEEKLFQDAGLVRGRKHDNIRRARIAWLDDKNGGDWALARVVDAVIAANRRHFDFDLKTFDEKMQVAWYGADAQGHFDWHVDIGDGALAAKRKLTIVVQLSAAETYEGGVLEINAEGRPQPAPRGLGSAILFPSFAPHRVTPITRGARYSLTTWVHGPPFR